MNYKLIYLWLVCLSFSLSVAAQHNTTIRGTIVDERSEAMPGAVIACFRKSDNQMLHATTSNAEGRFSLSIDWEKELLRISFLGYEDVEITDGYSDPLSIVLKPLSVELGEVVVKARSIVTREITSIKNIGTSFTADYQLTESQTIDAVADFSCQKSNRDFFATTLFRPLNSSVSDSRIY